MKKIIVVFGTRPEAIKMCPLVKELTKRSCFEVITCVTGQHKEMLESVLNIFEVEPQYNLDIMKEKQDLCDITSSILLGMRAVLLQEKPDMVLVHGDTSTTFSVALTCFYHKIPVAHIEAGLRTNNIYNPFPEEWNRQAVGMLSTFHFAPTDQARDNLLKEGKCEENIYVTGNTAIDALRTTIADDYSHPLIDWIKKDDKLILVTAHRRESIGIPMRNMFRAIRRVVEEREDVKIIYPIHMNPDVRKIADEELVGNDRIKMIEPLNVVDFHNFMRRSYFILTDSGGIQEEAPALGKPVLVMRENTERPEGVKAGTLKLVGTDEEKIYHAFCRLLDDKEEYASMQNAVNPYGDGTACVQIADILQTRLI